MKKNINKNTNVNINCLENNENEYNNLGIKEEVDNDDEGVQNPKNALIEIIFG